MILKQDLYETAYGTLIFVEYAPDSVDEHTFQITIAKPLNTHELDELIDLLRVLKVKEIMGLTD
jgi:hypothetical protein